MGFLLGSGGIHGSKINLQMQAISVVRRGMGGAAPLRFGRPATAVAHPELLASTSVIAL
jgi:hypothetical protein